MLFYIDILSWYFYFIRYEITFKSLIPPERTLMIILKNLKLFQNKKYITKCRYIWINKNFLFLLKENWQIGEIHKEMLYLLKYSHTQKFFIPQICRSYLSFFLSLHYSSICLFGSFLCMSVSLSLLL